MRHLIRTQVFDVTTNRKDDAFELQQRFRELFYETILPILEKAFDELAPGEDVVHIDKVEIDLGHLSVKDISTLNWTQKISESIGDNLSSRSFSNETEDFKKPLSFSVAQQWLFYMKRGYLPWNTISTNKQWYENALQGLASDVACIESLRALISTDLKAVKRIVYLHDNEFLTHLLETLTAANQAELFMVITRIQQALNKDAPDHRNNDLTFSQRAWREVLILVVMPRPAINQHATSRYVVEHVLSKEELGRLLDSDVQDPMLSPYLSRATEALDKPPIISAAVHEKLPVPDHQIPADKPEYPKESLFVVNAGAIILHPFLANLFSYLGLLKNQDFLSTYEKQKALKVLHFLCTGNTVSEEHELVVHKILCDYPLDEPVDPTIILSDAEQEECIELLKEVISRWTILKNTSTDGLRVNFLQRPGKLYTLNNEPHLIPEASVLDVLIDRLPWGIGIIKLPWMRSLLKVEWR